MSVKDRSGWRCASGQHVWTEQQDADKCCNPAWTRVLVVGSEALGADSVAYDAGARTIYGRRWIMKGE